MDPNSDVLYIYINLCPIDFEMQLSPMVAKGRSINLGFLIANIR
jgi:hypothetical protein